MMAIDVFAESVLSLADASKRLPKVRRGRKIHVSRMYPYVPLGKAWKAMPRWDARTARNDQDRQHNLHEPESSPAII